MTLLARLSDAIGPAHVLTGADADPWRRDWTGRYASAPLAVLRPGSTAEVAAVMAIAHATRTPVVPVSGNTGLNGGTQADGALVLSLDRMNRIRAIRPEARVAVVEAGVILTALHDAAAAHDLIFPLTFGARGSAMIGGVLSTNAGGSNVVRYGNTRDLCLGLEVVTADGQVMDLMTELHKDNSGLALRHLMIGAEGTLGLITAAVMKLKPRPRAYATALVALPRLEDALTLLNRVQAASGGMVEAFEFMPREYMEVHARLFPDHRPPFDRLHEVNILIELGAIAPRDADAGPDGTVPVVDLLEDLLGQMMEDGALLDAAIARSDAQRAEFWKLREQAAYVGFHKRPFVDTDVALPLDRIPDFYPRIRQKLSALDPGFSDMTVAHLGDGNLHYTVYPTDAALDDPVREAIEDVVADLGGSFSAEHGIGLSKLGSMRRRKDPVALAAMRAVKAALDPLGILNPGKVLPAARD